MSSLLKADGVYTHDNNRKSSVLAGAISQLSGMVENRKTDATSVLILTYMRSGSSLCGDILQQATDSFYIYEPFHAIGENPTLLRYGNGSTGLPPFDINHVKNDVMVNWFTCEIDNLPKTCIGDIFMKYGKKTKQFTECDSRYRAALVPELERARICRRELKEACLNSPIRIIKTIRMELQYVSHLLETLPNLKIVHLVRDPRATLASQRPLGMCPDKIGGLRGCTQSYCKHLENDILEKERLLKLYPDRIKTVFYEDIAKNPLETSKKMFDFIGSDFTKAARDYIYNITMAGNDNNCIICTTRSNSSEHVDTWKTTMKTDFLNIIQERCNYILKRYNY